MKNSIIKNLWRALLLACILVAGVAVRKLAPVEVTIPPSATGVEVPTGISDAERQRLIEEASNQLRKITESYSGKQKTLSLQTEKEVAEIIQAAESQAAERAAVDTAPFRGFKNASWCTYLAAKDDVFGGSEFTVYAGQAMEPTTRLLATVLKELEAKLASHQHKSLALANLYQKETLDLRSDLEGHGVSLSAPDHSSLAKAIGGVASESRMAALTVAVDALLIRSTIGSVKKVIGHLAARQAGAMTTAAGAAVADGPVPIGDAIGGTIAVVGTGMTAWGLIGASKALEALPGEVEASIRSELSRMSVEAAARIRTLDRECVAYYQLAAQ